MKKFNPKIFQEKNRVYPPVTGAPNVRKILIWDKEKNEYRPPSRGKLYVARRYEIDAFGKKRKSAYFESLEDARNWQSSFHGMVSVPQQNVSSLKSASGPTFQTIVMEWKERKFPTLRKATKLEYQRVSSRHFEMLFDYPINSISSKDIDKWLADKKANLGDYPQTKKRFSFDRELTILGIIFSYYGEYYEEDTSFRNPIKKRHWKDSKLNIPRPPKEKDVKREEFILFRVEVALQKHGKILKYFATVQYYQALRISEAAALMWKHIIFNWEKPRESRILVVQHAIYALEAGELPVVEPGFKNSEALGGIKDLPMFPETFEALSELYGDGTGKGDDDYVFPDEYGEVFKYGVVYHCYNRAFKKAGLQYKATHVLRHGGTNEVFDATGGDYGIAGQLLGDISDDAIKTYAKRRKSALTTFVEGIWNKEVTA